MKQQLIIKKNESKNTWKSRPQYIGKHFFEQQWETLWVVRQIPVLRSLVLLVLQTFTRPTRYTSQNCEKCQLIKWFRDLFYSHYAFFRKYNYKSKIFWIWKAIYLLLFGTAGYWVENDNNNREQCRILMHTFEPYHFLKPFLFFRILWCHLGIKIRDSLWSRDNYCSDLYFSMASIPLHTTLLLWFKMAAIKFEASKTLMKSSS